jgi:mRNA interferase RelE/StbE
LTYRVELKTVAKKQVARLPMVTRQRLDNLFRQLADNPHRPGVRRVRRQQGQLRARVGGYRVVFTVDERTRVVMVGRVALRDKAYKKPDRIDT